MNGFWWALIGAIATAPAWIILALLIARRTWLTARRMTRRGQGHEHLLEVSRLVGGLAHEIKNPLSTINLNIKLLLEDLERFHDEDHRRLLRRLGSVQGEADRLSGILEDFLRFAGRVELQKSQTDISAMVAELIGFFAPQADAARVVMRSSLPEKSVVCNIDQHFIKQALLNLLINAVDAMSSGGELLVRVTDDGPKARIEVIDTGKGIAPELMEKIFDIYYSTKKDGSGIGLAITRRLIRAHGGTIKVESDEGKGTRFTITLAKSEGE
ncbi:MAG TPA: two-component sensor histidine kinase [Phycisphaerae bacterium]|nr:two-component sensor histidine kinase [Phycisphaerae bacterium]